MTDIYLSVGENILCPLKDQWCTKHPEFKVAAWMVNENGAIKRATPEEVEQANLDI